MIDHSTRKAVRVSNDGISGPYIMVPVDQLDNVRKLLRENDIVHWVDHHAVSIDGKPLLAVVNLGKRSDPGHVQAILDAAT